MPSVETQQNQSGDKTSNNHGQEASGTRRNIIYIGDYEYDVTEWKLRHPGGIQVFELYDHKDATDAFDAMHAESSKKMLAAMPRKLRASKALPKEDPMRPGMQVSAPSPNLEQLEENWHKLRQNIIDKGLLKRNYAYYAYCVTFDLAFLVASLYLLWHGWWLPSAVLMGIFWLQWSFMGHDFGHNQVFENRQLNVYSGYTIVGLVGTGYYWWRERHNAHHLITNVLDVDPDVINLPLFCWDEREIPLIDTMPLAPSLIPYQHITFVPMLILLRLYWLIDTVMFILRLRTHDNLHYRTIFRFEFFAVLFYWTWHTYILTWCPSWTARILWVVIAHGITSFLMASNVFGNHDASPMMDTNKRIPTAFAELQIYGTRNYCYHPFFFWLSGGLANQIEHHLFPNAPRNNLPKIAEEVRKFCKDNNMPYDEVPWTKAWFLVNERLAIIANKYNAYKAKQAKLAKTD